MNSRVARALLVSILASSIAMPATVFADSKHAEAKAHFVAGEAHFANHEYDAAIDEYKLAYESDPNAVFIYNIAQSYRLKTAIKPTKSDCGNGVDYYKKYLEASPSATDKTEVSAWIAQLQACVEALPEHEAEPVPVIVPPSIVVTPPPEVAQVPQIKFAPIVISTPREPRSHTWATVLGSVGTGALALSGLLFFDLNREVNAAAGDCKVGTGCAFQEFTTREQTIHDLKTGAFLTLGIGAGLLITTAVLYTRWRHAEREHAPVAIVPTSGGAMMVTGGSF